MQFSFVHMADTHLGFRQYGLRERYNDFAQALLWAVREAVRRQVDFVVVAGDLFHQKSYVLPHTLLQMMQILAPLHKAGIPCVAIEGNHDKQPYVAGPISWVEFLARQDQDILRLLNFVPDAEGPWRPATDSSPVGHFCDPLPGVRVFGMGYKGAGTQSALAALAQALPDHARADVHYCLLMLHAGLEGQTAGNVSGNIGMGDLLPLEPHVDYLALGHYHKPFARDPWIYNPGSLEITSIDNLDYDNPGGIKLVEVDTARQPKHTVTHLPSPIRPWQQIFLNVNAAQTPEQLREQLLASVQNRLSQAADPEGTAAAPMVHITLGGRLNFPSSLLDLNRMKEEASATANALDCRIHLQASSHEGLARGEQGGPRTRQEIERDVLFSVIRANPRYADQAELWSAATLDLMSQALAKASPESLYATLSAYDDAWQERKTDADATA